MRNPVIIEPSVYVREVFTVQQPSVGSDLGLQLHLCVEQGLIILCLQLDVFTQLRELRLQAQEDVVEGLDLHVVTHLCVPQRALQRGFL